MTLRERCIGRALALLDEQGLKFTLDDLARSLHISKKTIYTAFSGKEELLLAVAERCFAEIKRSEAAVLRDPSLTLVERVRRLIIVLPEPYQNLNWYLMEDLAAAYPRVYRYVQERMESDWEPTLALLRQGMAQGVLRPFDLSVFKSMVEGCMEHFLTGPALKEAGVGYTAALEQMIDILLQGIVKERTDETILQ